MIIHIVILRYRPCGDVDGGTLPIDHLQSRFFYLTQQRDVFRQESDIKRHANHRNTLSRERWGLVAALLGCLFSTSNLPSQRTLPLTAWEGARLHSSRVLLVVSFISDVSGVLGCKK